MRSNDTTTLLLVLLGALALAAGGCVRYTVGGDDDSGANDDDDDTAGDDDDTIPGDEWPTFAVGVEYMQLGLAATYAGTGVSWAKTRLEAFTWDATEPEPPVDGVHTYDWSCTDAMILAYHDAGIVDLQSYLSPRSTWGSVDASDLGDNDIAPAPEHMEDYRAWVRALIERYDGDGVADVSGLAAPVRYWVVGPEWTGYWPSDDAASYIAFAEATAEEARDVFPQVRLGTIPFYMPDVFVPDVDTGEDPSPGDIVDRLQPPPTLRNSTEGIYAILDRLDLFDYLCVHSLGDYTEVGPTLAWFDAQMTQRGFDLPVWFDDATPMGPLANFYNFPALYPVDADQQDEIWEHLETLARLESGYAEVAEWIEALAAAGTVKKVVTALAEGAIGIQIGNTEDWVHDSDAALRHSFTGYLGAAAFMGMIDVDHSQGYEVCDERTPVGPRAAYADVTLLLDKLAPYTFTGVEALGTGEGVRGYAFDRAGHEVWVVWYEDGVLRMPGEAWPVTSHTFEVSEQLHSVTVTYSVTGLDGSLDPYVEDVGVAEGELQLPLSGAPLFVEIQ